MNLARLHVRKLLQSVDVPDVALPVVDVTEHRTVEAVARELRIAWQLPRGPIEDLTARIEDAGVLVIRSDFGVIGIDAISLSETRDSVPPVIFVSSAAPGDRLRFSLAHELGHLLLHHHLVVPDRDIEKEADRFASELLMPAADIGAHLSRLTLAKLASLKAFWKVSMQALLRRAEQLGRINERQRRYLWVQIGRLGYRTSEPVAIATEEPGLIKEIVQFHLEKLGYSERELSKLVGLVPHEFRTRYVAGSPALHVVRPRLPSQAQKA